MFLNFPFTEKFLLCLETSTNFLMVLFLFSFIIGKFLWTFSLTSFGCEIQVSLIDLSVFLFRTQFRRLRSIHCLKKGNVAWKVCEPYCDDVIARHHQRFPFSATSISRFVSVFCFSSPSLLLPPFLFTSCRFASYWWDDELSSMHTNLAEQFRQLQRCSRSLSLCNLRRNRRALCSRSCRLLFRITKRRRKRKRCKKEVDLKERTKEVERTKRFFFFCVVMMTSSIACSLLTPLADTYRRLPSIQTEQTRNPLAFRYPIASQADSTWSHHTARIYTEEEKVQRTVPRKE